MRDERSFPGGGTEGTFLLTMVPDDRRIRRERERIWLAFLYRDKNDHPRLARLGM